MGVEEYLQDERKMFIKRDRYFLPMETANNIYDIMDNKYLVDVNYQSGPSMLDKYGDVLFFMKNRKLDRQQQKWFKRVPLNVHYLRPVIKEEEGFLVDKDEKEIEIKRKAEDQLKSMIYYKTIDL